MVIAMVRGRPIHDGGIRRRPKDRKAQIARASAEAFSALGYHAVSMEAIASRVGISATALYRHYPSKYNLFRDAVFALGEQLVDCTDSSLRSSTPRSPIASPAASTGGRRAICAATTRPPSTARCVPSTAGFRSRSWHFGRNSPRDSAGCCRRPC